jgi:hypothetical protein
MIYDDVRGQPQGHFVVLSEYDTETREVVVADPLGENPRFPEGSTTGWGSSGCWGPSSWGS